MRRCLPTKFAFALIAMASVGLAAQDVFVLPASSSGSSNVAVFTADPFNAVAAPINLNPNSASGYISAASFLVPGPNNKYYIISNSSGASNPTVVVVTQNPDGSFTAPKAVAANLAGALNAFITPDRKWLFVVSGAGLVTLIDTSNDNIASLDLYFGGNVVDMAGSLDGSLVFALVNTATASHVSIINPAAATVVNTVTLSALGTGISVGPNGIVYVSTQNGIVQLNPSTYVAQFTIAVTGQPGKLYFTPDGTTGVAVNLAPSTGPALYIVNLSTVTVTATIPSSSFGGAALTSVYPVSNNEVFAYSQSAQALFDVTLNPANVSPFQFAAAGTVSGVTASSDIASGTHTATQYLFFTSGNTIQRYDVAAAQITGQQNLSAAPGFIAFGQTPITNGTPAALLTYGDNQSILPGTATGPMVVRVVNAQGQPLAGITVTFSSASTGVTFNNTSSTTVTATTTADGYAVTTVKATNGGQATVTASAGSLNATFTVNVGQGPSGPSQAGCLKIVGGQGQVVFEQYLAQPLTVLVTDQNGNPLANQQVTFELVSGSGSINGAGVGTANGTTQTINVNTDNNGMAFVTFVASSLLPGEASDQTQIDVSGPCGTGVTFYVSTVKNSAFGQVIINAVQVKAQPLVMSAGSKLTGAFSTAVSSSLGTALPHVSMFIENAPVSSSATPTTPPAMCDGGGSAFALSDTGGVLSCDLIATGAPGTYQIYVNVGYYTDYGPYTLIIQAGAPASVNIVGGNQQAGNPGETLPTPLTVQVTDANGAVLTGVPLTWSVTTGSGALSNVSSSTNSQGQGTATLTFGSTVGPVEVKVTAGTISATFNLTINAPVTSIKVVSGGNQSAAQSAPFASPLVFQVVNSAGNGVPGILVNFAVTSGTATLSSATGTTDQSGNVSITVTAGATAGPVVVTAAAGAFSTTANLTIIPPGPSNLVFLNGAGFQKAISPGAIVAIQGMNLVAGLTGVQTPGNIVGPLPTTFDGVTVTFNGTAAPIFSVASLGSGLQQIVVQAPYELGTAANATVNITTAGGGTATSSVALAPYAPGIFVTTAFGPAQAVATHANGSYVTPQSPAMAGENITIYLTGLGQTSPATGTNEPGIANQKVANPNVVVGINNAGVPVVSVLAAPGSIGVYTITFTVPSNAPSGNVPLNVGEFDASNNEYFGQGTFLPISQ